MLTLSRVSLHAAIFIAGWASAALVVTRIDAFLAPQSPQTAPVGLQQPSAADPAPIPAQGSQKASTAPSSPQYANGLLTGP